MSSQRFGPSQADLVEEHEPLKKLLAGWIGPHSRVLELFSEHQQTPLSQFLRSDRAKDVIVEELLLEELEHADGTFRAVLISNLDAASAALHWESGEGTAYLQVPLRHRQPLSL